MQISKLILGLGFAAFAHGAIAAQDITVYYSPTCPHCHHALDYIHKTLQPDYPGLKVTEVNVTEQKNRDAFMAVLKKCGYQSGGVPVMVVNEKCFQGYAEFMNTEILDALGAPVAAEAPTDDPIASPLPEEQLPPAKESGGMGAMLYIILGLLIAALGIVVFARRKK
ncbi:MAG: hypothetical protein FWF97_04820 [Alphaproteobacteria bacterium]|nr:hypothetical protein [Alphaproteobacteria bacterium]